MELVLVRHGLKLRKEAMELPKISLDDVLEPIHEHVLQVEIRRAQAAQEAQEHIGVVESIIRHVYETDAVPQVVHVAVVVVDEHHASLCLVGDAVGQGDDPLGLAGTLFSTDDLDQFIRLLRWYSSIVR